MTGTTALLALASVLLVSAIPLGGFLLLRREAVLKRAVPHLVSLAVGAMLGSALLELLPEGIAAIGHTAALLAVAGFVAFFAVEGLLSTHGHRLLRRATITPLEPYAILTLVGDGVHNAVDGAIIAASWIVSPALGASTTIAVVLHEVPHEVGDFGVLVQGGLSVKSAVLLNFGSALTAVLGALAMLAAAAWAEGVEALLLPIAAGNFLYVAAADLVPELHRRRAASGTFRQMALIVIGVLVVEIPRLVH